QYQPRTPLLEISLDRIANKHPDVRESFHQYDPQRLTAARHNSFQAMVRVMFGCDKFCSYCIVPSVRGPEQCRPPKEIVDEVKSLVSQGVIEVTLLGQTVNSYKYNDGGTTFELADILAAIHDIDGLKRIRFLTNYPRGMSNRLLEAVRDLPRAAPFLHIPAQSGADSVLRRMKRQYTVAEYRELLGRINEIVPDAAVTSDFIVGFCGETDDEFAETVELVSSGRFKNSYIFKYSERTGTKASELPDDISDEVKRRRNNDLLAVQNKISLELNETFVGKTVDVLVDGSGDKPNQLTSRTACDRIVMFDGNETLIGQFKKVKIKHAAPFTLFGELE
ncbi:MAG: MiaB/RimO family radical SAM methylthiotransferase, partial [Planctomycetaceae bacterium]|nr:MiaB/RimO family radical SAM methylthiotransferase [Planctomycetaceae bacterium]